MDRKISHIKKIAFFLCFIAFSIGTFAQSAPSSGKTKVNVKEIIFGHIKDSYEWHITTWGNAKITIPLPIIIRDANTGSWHVFSSSRIEETGSYDGFYKAVSGPYEGIQLTSISCITPE